MGLLAELSVTIAETVPLDGSVKIINASTPLKQRQTMDAAVLPGRVDVVEPVDATLRPRALIAELLQTAVAVGAVGSLLRPILVSS